jgi:hypothetical protein
MSAPRDDANAVRGEHQLLIKETSSYPEEAARTTQTLG